jgi:hypothetical protein
MTATCTGAPDGVAAVTAATCVAGACGVQPGGGTNALLGSAGLVDATMAADGDAIAWLGPGGGATAAACVVGCVLGAGGIQPGGGTNALFGSAGRTDATTGAGGDAIA